MLNKIIFCLVFTGSVAQAQQILKPDANTRVCGANNVQDLSQYLTRPPGPKPKQTIENVCKLIGVSAPNFTILATSDVRVPNALALISDGTRYILYNSKFIATIDENENTYYPSLTLLAHEIGHHVNGHSLKKCQSMSCQQAELEADQFAGCALQHAKATELDIPTAVDWMSPQGDAEHPSRATRQKAVQDGFKGCNTVTKPCEKSKTGKIEFRNKTNKPIEVSVLDGNGNKIYFTTIEVNGKGMLSVPAGVTRFKINKESSLWINQNDPTHGPMMYYKDETHQVVQCAENPPPIDIR